VSVKVDNCCDQINTYALIVQLRKIDLLHKSLTFGKGHLTEISILSKTYWLYYLRVFNKGEQSQTSVYFAI